MKLFDNSYNITKSSLLYLQQIMRSIRPTNIFKFSLGGFSIGCYSDLIGELLMQFVCWSRVHDGGLSE